jgi:DNA-binding response OmpR family regulator
MQDTEQQKRQILVVDDSREMVRHLASTLLPTYGFSSSYAFDGHTALQKIREDKPDLIILDLNLPGMTGLDVLEALAHEQINIPVVLITGDGSEKIAIEAFRLGVKDYIVKPFTVEEVIETIEYALGMNAAQSGESALAERLFVANNNIRKLQSRNKQLLQISQTITGLADREEIVAEALRSALQQCGAHEALLYLFANGDDAILYTQSQDEKSPNAEFNAAPNEIVREIIGHRHAIRRSNFTRGILLATGRTTRSILYVPIMHAGKMLGVLGVQHSRAPRAFSDQDEQFLVVLSGYVGIALRNAQKINHAVQDQQREHEALLRILHALVAQPEMEQRLNDVMTAVYRCWPVEACRLWLVDENSALMCVHDVGFSAESRQGHFVDQDDIIINQVLRSGQWMYRNEATPDTPLDPDHVVTHSMLCVPLTFQGTIVGVLQLLNKTDGSFDEADVAQAQRLAGAVALAVVTGDSSESGDSNESGDSGDARQ